MQLYVIVIALARSLFGVLKEKDIYGAFHKIILKEHVHCMQMLASDLKFRVYNLENTYIINAASQRHCTMQLMVITYAKAIFF